MLLIILLYILSRADSEWVEIAQNNYRRHSFNKPPVKAEFITESIRNYPNHTLNPPVWHKGQVNRVINAGNVKRIPFTTTKMPGVKIHADYYTDVKKPEYERSDSVQSNTDRVRNKQEYYNIDEAEIEKAASLYNENLKTNRFKQLETAANFNGLTTLDVDDEITYTNDNEWIYLSTSPTITDDQTEIGFHKTNIKSTLDKRIKFNRPLISLGVETNKNESDPRLHPAKLNTENEQSQNNVVSPSVKKNIKSNEPNRNKEILDVHSNLNKGMVDVIDTSKSPNELVLNTSVSDSDALNDLDTKGSEEFIKSQESIATKINVGSTKLDYLDKVWRLIKIISDTISKNTQKSVKSKVKYLEDLKNNIINTIEDRIDRAWPDDDPQNQDHTRETRSAHEHGHVELPSSESALMTISFLTFAVFLIKLVLQIIHTYKNKTMMMTPAVVTAVGRAAAAFKKIN